MAGEEEEEGGRSNSSRRRRRLTHDGGSGSGGGGTDHCQDQIIVRNSRKRRNSQNQVSRIKSSMNRSSEPDLDVEIFRFYYNYLPESLLLEILVRLPVKSIFRFKCVCKHWLSLISDPSFSRSYVSRRLNASPLSFRIFYRYIYVSDFREIVNRLRPDVYISPNFSVLFLSTFEERQQEDQFKVLAVSNGLLLCCLLGPLIYYVCDPVTRQWVSLPRGRCVNCVTNRHPIFFGEGLVTQVNEHNVLTSFKVVRVEWVSNESNYLNLDCFSSETGRWTNHHMRCDYPIRLLKRGGGPIHFSGKLHWFVYHHGMIVFDPYGDTKHCRLMQLPEDRDVESEYKYDGLYRLCDGCQGELRYFEVAPEVSDFCFSMWVLKDYEKGEWFSELRVTRSELWSDDANLSGYLFHVTFIPLSFHPFNKDVVYLRCVERSCIVSYNILTKRLDICCHPIGIVEDLSWRVVVPFELPMWPTPVPRWRKVVKRS